MTLAQFLDEMKMRPNTECNLINAISDVVTN